jgi:hypothetical protein
VTDRAPVPTADRGPVRTSHFEQGEPEVVNPRYAQRAVVQAFGVVLCGVLASCTAGSEQPPTPTAAPTTTAPSAPQESALPSVKTGPASKLCEVLDLATAQSISANLRFSPLVAPDQGTPQDACTYAADDGTTVLSLAPVSRPYETELELARGLVRDPASAGMGSARVEPVRGLGQAAFSESVVVLEPRQNVTYVIWRSGSATWVLSLAEVDQTDFADRLVPVARQISPRLPR